MRLTSTPRPAACAAGGRGSGGPTGASGRGKPRPPRTPDGRYFVAKSRLWRCTDPALPEPARRAAVKALMQARRDVMLANRANDGAGDPEALADARARVDAAKRALGERGPVWWAATDPDAPDEGGRHPANSSYAAWWAALAEAERLARS